MSRTNELRKVIQSYLETLRDAYPSITSKSITYLRADPTAMYPHIVYDFSGTDPTDMGREDYTLDINIFDKNQVQALDIADSIVDLFSFENAPQETILPTFYLTSVGNIEDPDKTICHTVVRFDVQNYQRS